MFERTSRQNLSRNWQHGTLWWNDPDAVTLTGNLRMNEYLFHATTILASGGMVLSGDDLTSMPPDRLAILRKLLPASGVAADFEGTSLDLGIIWRKDATIFCLFNWAETPSVRPVKPVRAGKAEDFWTGEAVVVQNGIIELTLPGHSARAVIVR